MPKALIKIAALLMIVFGYPSGPVLATDFTSTDFISRDPIISVGGGDSASASFQGPETMGQTAIGVSSSASFSSKAGFLYFSSPLLKQSAYRWYSNVDAITPVTPLAGQNASIANVNSGDVLRLRMDLRAFGEPYPKNSTFKLTYASLGNFGNCPSVPSGNYADVGAIGSGTIWRGFDNPSVADGSTLPSGLLTSSGPTGSRETYEEANSSAPTPDYAYVGVNADAEWDWVVQDNAAATDNYCFRMVKGDSSNLDGYLAIALLTTVGATPPSGGGGGGAPFPSNYSIEINNGDSCTAIRDVNLTLRSDNASEVVVSNFSDFSGSSWEPFTNPMDKAWTLSSGDGTKIVYAMYRNSSGNQSNEVSDDIVLDSTNNCGQPIVPPPPNPNPNPNPNPTPTPPPPVPAGSGVLVFDQPNYQGRSEFFSVDDPDLRDNLIGNDTISSFRIIGPIRLVLFEHIFYNGRQETFTTDDPDLAGSHIGDNTASSLVLIAPGFNLNDIIRPFATLFEKIGYLGQKEDFYANDSDLRDNIIGNDNASSFQLVGGAIVRLFKHINYGGIVELFTHWNADLSKTLIGDNTTSSIQVIKPGSLLKGSAAAVYYYDAEGLRHVFPNLETYLTWYPDFSRIIRLTDAELLKIEIGARVTYRPGVRMVKRVSDPKIYAVDTNKRLRWVTSEDVAVQLYGADWRLFVDDMPGTLFADYTIGAPIFRSADFNPQQVTANAVSPY